MTTENGQPAVAGVDELTIADEPQVTNDAPADNAEENKPPKTYTEEDFNKYQRELDRERRRIGKITAQKYQFKSEADQLRQQIAELQKKIPQSQEPQIGNYTDYNKYQQDLIDYRIKLQTPEKPAQQPQEDAQKAVWRAQRTPVLLQSVEQAKQTFPDIQQKLQENAALLDSLPTHVADAFLESDAPALAIAQLLEDGMIQHLAGMTPETAAAMIERAEDKALSRSKVNQQTKAPAPMSSARGTAPGSKTPDAMSGKEILKWIGD